MSARYRTEQLAFAFLITAAGWLVGAGLVSKAIGGAIAEAASWGDR